MTDFAYTTPAAAYVGAMGQAADGRNLGKNIIATIASQLGKDIDMARVPERIAKAAKEFRSVIGSAVAPVAKLETGPAPVTPITKARRGVNPTLTHG